MLRHKVWRKQIHFKRIFCRANLSVGLARLAGFLVCLWILRGLKLKFFVAYFFGFCSNIL